jgi:hypothetical protein
MHLLSTFLVISRVSGALLILSEQFWSAVRPFEHAPVALRRLNLPRVDAGSTEGHNAFEHTYLIKVGCRALSNVHCLFVFPLHPSSGFYACR